MSVLSAAFIARYSAAKVLNLSRPDDTSGTANDTVRIDAACSDAAADFEVYAGVVFDSTDARHIRIGCTRVFAILLERLGNEGAKELLKTTQFMLLDLAKVSSRGRILPRTSSVTVPTSETAFDGATPRPDFDRSRFRDFVPGSPNADTNRGT